MILYRRDCRRFFAQLKEAPQKRELLTQVFVASGAKQDADRFRRLCPQGGPTADAGAPVEHLTADTPDAAGGEGEVVSNSAANANKTAAADGPTADSSACHHPEHVNAEPGQQTRRGEVGAG